MVGTGTFPGGKPTHPGWEGTLTKKQTWEGQLVSRIPSWGVSVDYLCPSHLTLPRSIFALKETPPPFWGRCLHFLCNSKGQGGGHCPVYQQTTCLYTLEGEATLDLQCELGRVQEDSSFGGQPLLPEVQMRTLHRTTRPGSGRGWRGHSDGGAPLGKQAVIPPRRVNGMNLGG